jgi:RNA polymerase sigma-70 factor (ECF subfamily)
MVETASGEPVGLLRAIAGGDRDAFGRFYDRYASLVFTTALRMLRSRPDAEDLLQEVFLQVWRQAGRYSEERGQPEAWLLTITRSRGIDRLRSTRRRDDATRAPEAPRAAREDAPGTVASAADQAEAKLTVTGVLGELSDAQRHVLELAYFDGLTQSEIATRLGEPLGTVKTRIRSGLQALRSLLGTAGSG